MAGARGGPCGACALRESAGPSRCVVAATLPETVASMQQSPCRGVELLVLGVLGVRGVHQAGFARPLGHPGNRQRAIVFHRNGIDILDPGYALAADRTPYFLLSHALFLERAGNELAVR